ncbi:MAG: hypothetical protein Ctma_0644 [Catillopecten margaritatus gill symbiont]|uniref:Glycosyl transferase family 25 domain-containing protein n=1 Tax=Catillopecten margaritatus gill symbiont TaxID=3083288 RepID=A0AAU6PFZ9_9GAMM
MNIFVINLKSATERRAFQRQQLTKLNLGFEFIDATTIKDISNETYQKHYYDWQRPLQKTEVACYFSHQKLWSRVVADNQPALILEDDVLLSKHTAEILKELEKRTNLEMVNLEVFDRKKYVSKNSEPIKNHQLFYLHQDRAGAAAYILYPKGAKKLLQYQQHGIALADVHLHNCPSLNSYQVEPACAVQLMFCQEYNIKQHDINISQSLMGHGNNKEKRTFIFKVKRMAAQIKLGFRQLLLMTKSDKRNIKLNSEDFS